MAFSKDDDFEKRVKVLRENINRNQNKQNNHNPRHKPQKSRTSVFGLLFVMIILCIVIFSISYSVVYFYSVKKSETFILPSFFDQDIESAIFKMQKIGVYPFLEVSFDPRIQYKNKIISQDPDAGTKVGPGRKITIVLSKGPAVDKISNYIGQNYDEVESLIKSLYSNTSDKLINIGDVEYKFNDAKKGTILDQSPKGESPINGKVSINFVISKGPEVKKILVPDLTNLYFLDAIKKLSDKNLNFIFSISNKNSSEEGVVVSQNPNPDSFVEEDKTVNLSVSNIFIMADSDKFSICSYELPKYSTRINIDVEFIMPSGRKNTYFSIKTFGGKIAFPYLIEKNTIISISSDGKVLYKEVVN